MSHSQVGKGSLTASLAPASGARLDRAGAPAPGKRTLTEALPPVQRTAGDPASPSTGARDETAVRASAARGVMTAASPLPFGDRIQRAFGRHDVASIQAHVGSDAARSARDMGATAYATGNHVVLGSDADLHTAAHEAAHVVQQRGGVHLKGGVGEEADPHERHADEVAALVVQGKSAEGALDRYAGTSGAPDAAGPRAAQIQMLPLSVRFNTFQPDEHEHAKRLSNYIDQVLVPEINEVKADDQHDADQYDHRWKSDVIHKFSLLQASRSVPQQAQQALEEIQALLFDPRRRSPPSSFQPAPDDQKRAVKSYQGPEINTDFKSNGGYDTAERMGKYEAAFQSGNPETRENAVKTLRGRDEKHIPGQGAIYYPFIADYRKAILGLLKEVKPGQCIFSLERGGSMIADMMLKLSGESSKLSYKIEKPTSKDVEVYLSKHGGLMMEEARAEAHQKLEAREKAKATKTNQVPSHTSMMEEKESATDLPVKVDSKQVETRATQQYKKTVTGMQADPKAQKQVHHDKFVQVILEYVKAQKDEVVEVVITETAVGGGSSNLLFGSLNRLCKELRNSGKKVKFKCLLMRETIKNTNSVGKGTLKVHDPVYLNAVDGRAQSEQMRRQEPLAQPEKLPETQGLEQLEKPSVTREPEQLEKQPEKLPEKQEPLAQPGERSLPEQQQPPEGSKKPKDSGIKFPQGIETDNLEQVEVFISQTRYLLGEDVDYQMQYSSPLPVIVFQGSEQDVVALSITPTGGDSARGVLLDLVAGAFDSVMKKVFETETQ